MWVENGIEGKLLGASGHTRASGERERGRFHLYQRERGGGSMVGDAPDKWVPLVCAKMKKRRERGSVRVGCCGIGLGWPWAGPVRLPAFFFCSGLFFFSFSVFLI
jgi:hypothetical protein